MNFGKYGIRLFAFLLGGLSIASLSVAQSPSLTVGDARNLPARELAVKLIGNHLGSQVIQAVRRQYEGSTSGVPKEVDLFTQPKSPWPLINGICFTDVITIEYDWFEHEDVSSSTPLSAFHVGASSRFKAFPMPSGDLGYDESIKFQEAECAKMQTALDAFRAPSAGDAQWLARIENEYRSSVSAPRKFELTCDDFQDASCGQAAKALSGLKLSAAREVQLIDCPARKAKDQVSYCYRLTFPYAETDDPEWIVSVVGGIADGGAPVEIRSLNVEHVKKPIVIP